MGLKRSAVDLEVVIQFALGRHAVERCLHGAVGGLVEGVVINFRLLENAQPVVGGALQFEDLHAGLEQFDGGQETGPLQSVPV